MLLSAGVRLWLATGFTVPWIAPDEMVYGLLGQSLWESGELTVRGAPTAYYSLLTPALVGLPLSLDDVGAGVRAAQGLQVLAMSLVAVPVFLWGRPLAGARWGLAAAVLCLLPPAHWYGGLLMTEALFVPLVTTALLATARALEEPTALRQGVLLLAVTAAACVRLQGLILLAALFVGVGLHAWFGRSGTTAWRLAPVLALLVLAGLGTAVVQGFAASAGWDQSLGAYAVLASEAPSTHGALQQAAWHGGALVLLTLGLPLLATASLVVGAAAGREPDPAVRAFAAVTAAYVLLLVGQVSAFAAGYLDHVGQRYLVTALPPLFLGLCVWLRRGAPRTRAVAVVLAAGAVALVASIPPDRLAVPEGLHDTFATLPLLRLGGEGAGRQLVLIGVAVLAGTAFVALPRRALLVGAGVVAAGLTALSLASAREIERLSRAGQVSAFGAAEPGWVDDAGGTGVTLLNAGARPWPAVMRAIFWNRSIVRVLRLDGVDAVGPVPQAQVTLRPDGLLVDATGRTVEASQVVTSASVVPAGDLRAATPPTPDAPGWSLWRAAQPLRVVTVTEGVNPIGDFTGVARVAVYGCAPGRLELTLLGKGAAKVEVRVDGIPVRELRPPRGGVWTGAIPAPWYATGKGRCVFELDSVGGPTGSTRVEWRRAT